MPRHHLDWMMPSNWQEPMVRLPGSLIVCNTPYSNILPGLYVVQSTACWIWGSGTARFKYRSLQLYEALLGRKYLCVHAGSRVFSTEQRFGDKSDLLQLPPPPPPQRCTPLTAREPNTDTRAPLRRQGLGWWCQESAQDLKVFIERLPKRIDQEAWLSLMVVCF